MRIAFYAEIHPTFGQAMKYSVATGVIMRNDDGREVVAWSRLGRAAAGRGIGERLLAGPEPAPSEITLFRYAWIWQAGRVEICCANTGRCCYRKSATRPGQAPGTTDHPGKRLAFLIPRAHLS